MTNLGQALRPRQILFVALLASLALSARAGEGKVEAAEAEAKISVQAVTPDNADKPQVRLTVEHATLKLRIISKQGVGECALKLEAGRWPKTLLVELCYAEGQPFTKLEGFAAALMLKIQPQPHKDLPLEESKARKITEPRAELTIPADLEHKRLVLSWVDIFAK